MKQTNKWIFERAPEPTDIYWENLQFFILYRAWYFVLSMIATAAVLIGFYFLVYVIKD